MSYYIGTVIRQHQQYPKEVERYFTETFNKPFSHEVLTEIPKADLKAFTRNLKSFIAIETSPLTLEQVQEILLAGETAQGASLQAFTDYTCKECSVVSKWHNSCVPKLCEDCRLQAAENVIRSGVLKRIMGVETKCKSNN